jgi:hypothetical protein
MPFRRLMFLPIILILVNIWASQEASMLNMKGKMR